MSSVTEQLASSNTISLLAGADLTAAQFKFVKMGTDGRVVLAGIGDNAIGVLKNKPNTNESAGIQIGGIVYMQADAAIANTGTKVMSSADGQAVTAVAAAARHVLGVTVTTVANAGEYVEVLLHREGILA